MENAVKHFLFVLVQCTWGAVQNLGGLAVFLFLAVRRRKRFLWRGCPVTVWRRGDSASVGMFLFISERLQGQMKDEVLVHEYGHTVQSALLGPLYLPVISLPSAVWCLAPELVRMRSEKNISYYSFYTEKWANHLGQRVTGIVPELLK